MAFVLIQCKALLFVFNFVPRETPDSYMLLKTMDLGNKMELSSNVPGVQSPALQVNKNKQQTKSVEAECDRACL